MYKEKMYIRFSETDESGHLSSGGLLRIFQDCGYSHAHIRGQTPRIDEANSATWYLLRWHIEKYKMPVCHEEVEVSTWIYRQSASIAYKQIIMKNVEGEILALGDTMWVYVDILSECPILPPKNIWCSDDFGEKIQTNKTVNRIRVVDNNSSNMIALPPEKVDFRFLDINHHANNVLFTEYAMMLCKKAVDCKYIKATPHNCQKKKSVI